MQAQGRTLAELSLNAHAVLDRATAAGGVATATTLDGRIANRRLDVDVDGDVAHVDPAVATTVASAAGDVSGHVKGHVSVANLGATPTAEAFGFDGDVHARPQPRRRLGHHLGVDVAPARRRRARRAAPRGGDAARRGHRIGAARAERDGAVGPGVHDPRHPADAVPRADRRGDGDGRRRRPAVRAAGHAADRRHGTLRRRRRRRRRAGPRGDGAVQRRPARLGRRAAAPRRPSGADGRRGRRHGPRHGGRADRLRRRSRDVRGQRVERRPPCPRRRRRRSLHAGRAPHHADGGGPVDRRADVGARRGAAAGHHAACRTRCASATCTSTTAPARSSRRSARWRCGRPPYPACRCRSAASTCCRSRSWPGRRTPSSPGC